MAILKYISHDPVTTACGAVVTSQSRKASLTESIANTLIGYGIAIAAQVAIFPLFGIYIGAGEHAAIGLLFTLVSLARSYALRRLFETLRVRGVLR